MSKDNPILLPGVYYDMPAEDYHSDPAIGSSRMVKAARSMAHYWMEDPTNPNFKKKTATTAMSEGTAMHCYLLEPDVFDATYYVLPEDAPRKPTKIQRNAAKPSDSTLESISFWDTLEAYVADGKRVICTAEEKEMYIAMAERLKVEEVEVMTTAGESFVFKLKDLFTVGKPEVSFFWLDPHTGLMCKCRVDWFIHTKYLRWIFDYKTTRSADAEDFERQASDLLYWVRGPFYSDGVTMALKAQFDRDGTSYENSDLVFDYMLLAQEKEEPYLAQSFIYQGGEFDKGREMYRSLLTEIAHCKRTFKWPGYSRKVHELLVRPYTAQRYKDHIGQLIDTGRSRFSKI